MKHSGDFKAFSSWQFRWNAACIAREQGDIDRALGQMRHHWGRLTEVEKREAHETFILPMDGFAL